MIEYLAGRGTVLGNYGTYGKIVLENGTFRVADTKTARQYLHERGRDQRRLRDEDRLGAQSAPRAAWRRVSSPGLQPNEAFIMGGKPVRVKYTLSEHGSGGTGKG